MYKHHHWSDDDVDDEIAQRQTAGLVAIAIILLLLVGGLFLVQRLCAASMFQDCLLSGRHDCDMVIAPPS
jgi:hypothetical protein